MGGHNRHERTGLATPLELLFDLTFAISFGLAASQFAYRLAEGHYAAGLLGFGFASSCISWAWINFSWFASAYGIDDRIFWIATIAQTIGVLILGLGLPDMFDSIEHGERLDTSVMVLGYVIMRAALASQWLRAAQQHPARRRACLTYAIFVSLAQVGWVTQIFLDLSVGAAFTLICILLVIELAGLLLAERTDRGTAWDFHHIAKRHGVFATVTLARTAVGMAAGLSAIVEEQGWTRDAALVGIAGVGLTCGMWWVYYLMPSASVLHTHRNRAFIWGSGQMLIVTALVATGAGLQVTASFIEDKAHISPLATVLFVAVPVTVFLGLIYALHFYLVRHFELFHVALLTATAGVMAVAVIMALSGISMALCLVILMLAPAVTIIGHEMRGYRDQAEALLH
jgi:low temperature requirement protein LtrA